MNTDDLRRQYKGVAYPPLVAAICFFDSEGFEDDANQAAEKYASYQAIATAARDARIALTFYREWMLTHGEGETKYPFGVDAERTLAAALAALEQETK